ncbi:cyclic nucleotide-binding domain-containing protein [Actinoplanes sp. NPDC023714]|uniref:cyclic nucleotide-binding domain-containing protein n=1 Tax=Actinoplanes sp. NPDC023714 TaxID=3154322 RepID=UPI0033CC7AE9
MNSGTMTHPFLAGLRPALLTELAEHAIAMHYPDDYRIFSESDPANRFWLIEDGTVALDLHVPGRGAQVFETIGPGTVLGWSWLFPPYRWQFGAVARGPVQAIEFGAEAVRERCARDPEFGYAILSRIVPVLGDRLRTARLRLLDLWGRP